MPSSLKSVLCCFSPSVSGEGETSRTARHVDESTSSSPRASGLLVGLGPRHALSDGECQLGGYLMAREYVAGPVQGADFASIRRANQTVIDTRRALRHGRGNVRADIDYSGGQSTVRTEAGRRLEERLLEREVPPDISRVASALTAQAGNCAEHADIAAFLHAAHMRDGEQVYTVGHEEIDHAWAEWRGEGAAGERRIVMDAHHRGSAIFAEDGAYSHNEDETVRDHDYNRTYGAHVHAEVRKLSQKRLKKQFRKEMNKVDPNLRYHDDNVWDTTAVVSPEFAASVSEAMFRPLNTAPLMPPPEFGGRESAEPVLTGEQWMMPLRHQIHAGRMARRLDANGVQEVARAAMRISEVATDLTGFPVQPHPQQFEHDDF
jgi:hypothetical protein